MVSDGTCKSLTVCGENTYFIFERENGTFLERLDESAKLDNSRILTLDSSESLISGLEDFNGQTIQLIANGAYQGTQTVTNGQITLNQPTPNQPTQTIEIGLPFSVKLAPLPLSINGQPVFASLSPVRLVRASFRLQDSTALLVNTGRGNQTVLGPQLGTLQLDQPTDPFSGEKTIHALGWCEDTTQPLWKIEQDLPEPLTVLSVNAEIAINA